MSRISYTNHPTSQILARVLGMPLISDKGWVEHCASASLSGRVRKASGDVARVRRSLKGRFRETIKVKWHPFKKRTIYTLRRRSHLCSAGVTWGRKTLRDA